MCVYVYTCIRVIMSTGVSVRIRISLEYRHKHMYEYKYKYKYKSIQLCTIAGRYMGLYRHPAHATRSRGWKGDGLSNSTQGSIIRISVS